MQTYSGWHLHIIFRLTEVRQRPTGGGDGGGGQSSAARFTLTYSFKISGHLIRQGTKSSQLWRGRPVGVSNIVRNHVVVFPFDQREHSSCSITLKFQKKKQCEFLHVDAFFTNNKIIKRLVQKIKRVLFVLSRFKNRLTVVHFKVKQSFIKNCLASGANCHEIQCDLGLTSHKWS